MRIVYLLVAVASLIAPQQAVAPQDPEAAARQAAARQALARPVTAGSVPFLIPHGRYANVAARIADALRDDRVDVRAVAARSIFVLAGKIYAALVAEALAVERDATAGAEMVRALLAIRGEAAEPEAIAAATRLGPAALNAISVTLAHTRPLDVLKWLTELARDEAGLADALLRAIAVDADAVARAVQSAPADADLDAIDAMFGRAVSLDLVIPPAVVDVSLRRGGRLQISALWYLVARGDAVRASGALAELGSAPGAGEVAGWIDLLLEFIRRADPAQPRRDLVDIGPRLDPALTPSRFWLSPAVKRLSKEEMKALESRLGGIPTRTLQDGFAPPRSLWTEPRGMRVAEMFVPGLDAAVAETAGCRTGAEQFSVMDVTYGERGEVRNVRLAADVGSPACREAAAILAVLEVAPVAALPPAERTDQVVSVFTRDALECERRLDRGQRARSAPGDGISEPKRVHSVKPAYPPELIAARIQGKVVVEAVIDGLGCISRAAVVARVHPELDIRALVAVSQWRYTPTLLNGEPVPVIMTATVQYFLQ